MRKDIIGLQNAEGLINYYKKSRLNQNNIYFSKISSFIQFLSDQ